MVASTFDEPVPTGGSPRQALPVAKVVAVGIGNALEFYDFITYSFFAIQIGHCFFPPEMTAHGLLLSLATFGVGFVLRPVGAIVIGIYGDRVGRRPAMVLSFALMGASLLGVVLTPSYARIGIAAPILLVLFRLAQGFALGGEVGPATAFLIEAAPPNRRGLYVSVQFASQNVATVAGGLMGYGLSAALDGPALDAWGWRVALAAGLAVVPVGLMIRRNLPETIGLGEPARIGAESGRLSLRLVVVSLVVIGMMTIATYVLGYMTTYAQDSLHIAADAAFATTIIKGICGFVCDPLGGLLSDRLGRRPVALVMVAICILMVVPAFFLMVATGSVAVLYAATAALGLAFGTLSVPLMTAITEALPKSLRCAALSTLYAGAVAVFGGSTQPILKYLLDATGNPLVPAWYLTSALVIGAVGILLMPETAPVKTGLR
jgi:MFS family permease